MCEIVLWSEQQTSNPDGTRPVKPIVIIFNVKNLQRIAPDVSLSLRGRRPTLLLTELHTRWKKHQAYM